MSVINNNLLLGAPAAGGGGGGNGYQISRSLRFNSADLAYLSRTPTSVGNRKTWTWAGWVKRIKLGAENIINVPGLSGDLYFDFLFGSGDFISITQFSTYYRRTTQVFRDCGAWMHLVLSVDTTSATANNRVRLYVNGSEVTQFSTLNNPAQNTDLGVNQASQVHYLANSANLYLADIHFIDGQALDPTSFGAFDSNGVWQPKAYSGSYGTNGFKLNFSDNSAATAAALGKDSSGNGNNWTPNNLSVTAGSDNDSLVDTPTSYGTDTGVGGEVRGNYATLNPLTPGVTGLSNGNLDAASANAYPTIIPGSGNWYYEVNGTGYQWNGTLANWTPRAGSHNFGQRPFAYTAPSGYKALCSTNLPTPTILNGATAMDTVLYTGTGATLTPTSSLGFSPDLVWIKGRSGATDHALYDTVRGVQLDLASNLEAAETTQAQGLTAFNSNGFTVGTLAKLNTSAATYAGWCWDAGTTTVTDNTGSIQSTRRTNVSAGFSIVAYSSGGNGSILDTVGHGLGISPSMVIAKNRDLADSWYVLRSDFSNPVRDYLHLNSTAAKATVGADAWSFSSTTVGIRQASIASAANQKIVLYCFAPVSGYSAFGSYTGNGSADGPFVYTGFRPRWIMVKSATTAGTNWLLHDTARSNGNVSYAELYSNLRYAEQGYSTFDILSNGFKVRDNSFGNANTNGATHVYAAFAEHPFALARAR